MSYLKKVEAKLTAHWADGVRIRFEKILKGFFLTEQLKVNQSGMDELMDALVKVVDEEVGEK